MHPVFGQFTDDCQDMSPTEEAENTLVYELAATLSSFQTDETPTATNF